MSRGLQIDVRAWACFTFSPRLVRDWLWRLVVCWGGFVLLLVLVFCPWPFFLIPLSNNDNYSIEQYCHCCNDARWFQKKARYLGERGQMKRGETDASTTLHSAPLFREIASLPKSHKSSQKAGQLFIPPFNYMAQHKSTLVHLLVQILVRCKTGGPSQAVWRRTIAVGQ